MSRTSCSITDCTTRSVASRWAAVNSRSVNRLAAFLYSCRWANWGVMPLLSSAPRRNGTCVAAPVTPTSPDGCSQIWSKLVAR